MDYKKLLYRPLPAPLWRRGLAYLVDAVIVALIVTYPLQSFTEDLPQSFTALFAFLQAHPSVLLHLVLLFISLALVSILYWAILEYKLRQSLGKMLFRISVVSTTKRFTFWQCFVRNITKFSDLLLLLDVLYLLFKGEHQRYFEILSHTQVVAGGPHGKN